MNIDNPLTSIQITEIFRHHGLAQNPSTARLATGFTNEVYAVDTYILKVCGDPGNEAQFCREVYLYALLRGHVPAPDPIIVDTSRSVIDRFYMIYRRIEGGPLGSRWHLLPEVERKQFVQDLCLALRRIDNFPMVEYARKFGLNSHLDWKFDTVKGLFESLSKIHDRNILSEATQQAIRKFIRDTQDVLTPQKLGLVFWDVQLDNMLFDSRNRFAALIDFEGVSIASIDYRLMLVRVMSERPHLFMSVEMEQYAHVEDYASLMEWYREFYPELFAFPDLEKRLDLYELGDILNHLLGWPKAVQLHDRLAKILATARVDFPAAGPAD